MAPHLSGLNNNSPNAASTRQIVSSLVSAIPPPPPPIGVQQQQQSANPLREAAAPETRNVFLTLYALFEKELLPALDLLDRGLVTRLKAPKASLLLVRSAQQQQTRNPAYEHVNYYEVRLDAWSCSCPAFTFSAFPAVAGRQTSDAPSSAESHGAANEKFELFGGFSRGTGLPICKHLLACALVEHCQLFAHFVDEREVSIEEIAGWAAGWGD